MNNKFLIGLGLLVACATIATGIECYVCSYSSGLVTTGSQCSGPTPSASFLINCTSSNCIHVVGTVSAAGVTQTTVTRSCGTAGITTGCQSVSSVETCTYSCTTDRCNSDNGSNSVKMSAVMMLMSLMAGFLFSKF